MGWAIVLLVCAFQLWVSPYNPPGFHHDEASLSLNAYELSRDLHDEHGALLPLYFPSFGDYKNPVFPYLLAGVFRVAGPSEGAARGLAAVSVLAAILLLGVLAWRLTRSAAVALTVIALGGTMPWLFEFGRVAYDTSMLPLGIVLVLLASHAVMTNTRPRNAVLLGLALTVLLFVSTAGRLLAPLLAAALIVLARRRTIRMLGLAWGVFAVTGPLPALVYALRHPGALTARYDRTAFSGANRSVIGKVGHTIGNELRDLNLWHWTWSGDPKPYVHTSGGSGMLYLSVAVLGLVGLGLVLLERRTERWWLYVVVTALLLPVPAALTADRFYSLRLVGIPLVMIVLAVPTLELLRRSSSLWVVSGAVAALLIVTVYQFVHFVSVYRANGPNRTIVFEAGVAPLLVQAFSTSETIYVDHDDAYALTHARWFAIDHHLPEARVVRLPDGGVPPDGSTVFGRLQGCDYRCDITARSEDYWVAHAVVPAS